jgi:putative transposase
VTEPPIPKHGGCRRSIRLKDFDYARSAAYYLTICAKDRACLFGTAANDAMRLNDAGKMVERWWRELNRKFPNVETDEYVIMPNHFHGIVVINDVNCGDEETERGGWTDGEPRNENERDDEFENGVPTIVQWFKTMTTNEYIRGVKTLGWPAFPGKLWQRNYYEHIIRNDVSLERIRQYIVDNPEKWALDRENPAFARQNEREFEHEPGNTTNAMTKSNPS